MAPEAPTRGTSDEENIRAWDKVAAMPVSRYQKRYGSGPSRRSTLSP